MKTQKELGDISVQYLKGVGPGRAKLFANLGVASIEDLLYLFPHRYEDRTKLTPLSALKVGQCHTVTAHVIRTDQRRAWYTHKHVCEIEVADKGRKLTCVWFNQPYMTHYFKVDDRVVLFGKVDVYKDRLQMVSPEYEVITEDEDASLSIGRIVPIYPLTRGLSQRTLRKIIKYGLDHYAPSLKEVLPYSIRQKYGLENLVKSILNIHFPESFQLQETAYKRISFEEFFLFQVSVFLRRLSIVAKDGIRHQIRDNWVNEYGRFFPFALTKAQTRVIQEIADDMQRPSPMHRLLQGDVGSGKTLVAFFGCVAAGANGYQSALMAPTEILARQHFETLQNILKSITVPAQRSQGNGPGKGLRMALLVSGLKQNEKEQILGQLKRGEIDLLVGTHALIQEEIEFKNLSFVIVDEQHKFGVRQRALLSAKGGNPHVLVMTATPIPRTLCHTLYGDLDVSVIDELPSGRGEVRTILFSEERIEEVYGLMRQAVLAGRQVYVVYPIIEESSKLDLKAAKGMFKYFREVEFKDCRVGIIHGQMKKSQTQEAMDNFKNKKFDILVATTILEVGVDVPNATVMVIEHAERFGLAQLHQLRGRIGRGTADSLCLVIAEPVTQEAQARLKAFVSTTDGFKIAQEDLLIRGPGEFFGRHQHGLNELKVANPVTQLDILEAAREEAMVLTKADPKLEKLPHRPVKELIEKRYPNYLAMVQSG